MISHLRDKCIVVIGGTSGLGLSATRACIEAGARVVAVGRDASKAADVDARFGEAVRTLVADATDPVTAVEAIARARAEFGAFHGLYHVAGGSGRRHGDGPLHDVTDAGWERTMTLTLTSAFNSNRAAARAFMESGTGGSVVNCASVLGFDPSPAFFATHAYAASKAAVIGMTRSSAAYYATRGIRFNVLAPALVATPMSRRAQEDAAILEFIKTKQPLDGGRIGQPEDLDGAVVWLLSDQSRFVTGQVIAIDGGWGVSDGQIGPR